ncbi:GxxExxY protein [Flavobacterium endophyticum]|uniref:GxxExxY protein n=1 Tax=Flavobacterium endophyticum TaxID=1540163 RepID=A0A495M5H1_9FLAO|nr:GxxExxY protein [Flavobacterium endophyticum]RKS20440.1 GxxExxY protein [Flavobacterium endophyticum]
METDELLHKELTGAILKLYYEVYNELGYGFLERVYQNAMFYELKANGYKVEAQKRIPVYYKEIMVGDYFADLIVNDCVILELKAVESLAKEHHYQIINYLRGTDCEVGLVLNFGKKAEFMRRVYENYQK